MVSLVGKLINGKRCGSWYEVVGSPRFSHRCDEWATERPGFTLSEILSCRRRLWFESDIRDEERWESYRSSVIKFPARDSRAFSAEVIAGRSSLPFSFRGKSSRFNSPKEK